MSISRDKVETLAELSRLELSERELSAIAQQLDAVLDFASSLEELDLDDVPETTAATIGQQLRTDGAPRVLARAEVLELAPERDETHYLVPQVVSND